MKKNQEIHNLLEETKLFLRYGIPEERHSEALKVVDRYCNDASALYLLREFYRSLPEVREEPVSRIVELAASRGVKLLAIIADSHDYLYVVDGNQVLFLGENGEDIEEDNLVFFGFPAYEDFRKTCQDLRDLEDYDPSASSERLKCPICLVLEGEYHQFGCPVEVCPWCAGQLNRCNCRFDKLGTEQIDTEEELDRFHRLLLAKGRIRFSQEQAPAYPSAGDGGGLDD
jgi:hypothetical protein